MVGLAGRDERLVVAVVVAVVVGAALWWLLSPFVALQRTLEDEVGVVGGPWLVTWEMRGFLGIKGSVK